MQTTIGLTALASSPRSPLELKDHPVFQVLPSNARQAMLTNSQTVSLTAGDILPKDGDLYFILSGVIGLFPNGGRICVAAVTAGSVHGWDQALDPDARRPEARALIDTLLCRIVASPVVEAMGREWLTRLVAHHAISRLDALATEAACNAAHKVTERLAKWVVRLHSGGNGAPLLLTQADFGAMLGVQRTSVNAAAGRLQGLNLIRFGRRKIQVLNLDGLRQTSCQCGETVPRALKDPRPLGYSPSGPTADFPVQRPAA
jgi:CRP-like cAMP-binding protein